MTTPQALKTVILTRAILAMWGVCTHYNSIMHACTLCVSMPLCVCVCVCVCVVCVCVRVCAWERKSRQMHLKRGVGRNKLHVQCMYSMYSTCKHFSTTYSAENITWSSWPPSLLRTSTKQQVQKCLSHGQQRRVSVLHSHPARTNCGADKQVCCRMHGPGEVWKVG